MTVESPPRAGSAPRGGIGLLVCLAACLGMAVGAGLVVVLGDDGLARFGLPDPGLFTTAAFPAVRILSECAAVVTVGLLLFAAFLVPPQASGYLDTAGYHAVRTARVAALVWASTAALMVPLLAADAVGRPVTEVVEPSVLTALVSQLDQAGAWALTAGIALAIAAFCWFVLSWGSAVWLFLLALAGLLPVAMTGHSASGGAHDLAVTSLLYHLVAAALWVGGLVAVLIHLARGGPHRGLAARRFSRLALVCWLVLAASGVVNALIRISPAHLFSTYGLMILGKVTALIALGVIGWLHRRGAVAAVEQRGDRWSMLRLGSVEVLIMFATIGLAVALGRTAPPADAVAQPSRTEILLGYDLSGPPTVATMLLEWRLDLIFGVGALVLAGLYLAGVRRLVSRGDAWPVGRTAAWLCGCAVILIATSSGIGRYSMAMFSVHMSVHMLLSMLAPILLVLGAPATLALRALPPAGADNPPGPREWLQAFLRSWVVRMSTKPLMAVAMFVGSFYVLYFTDLFDLAVWSHTAHLLMTAHFLLMGYIYYWVIIGIDPSPHRVHPLVKLGLLMVAMPFHAFFGIRLMGSTELIAGDFYRTLALPFVPDLVADQQTAGAMAWATGEIPMVIVLIALLVQWSRADSREARRLDRKARSDGDADLAAYNEMLAKLANRPPPH